MSLERQQAILERQIEEILEGIEQAKAQKAERYTVKQMERTRKSLETRLAKLNDQSRKDDTVTFEQLGVDRLFIDESHYFKNLFLATKMRNVGGIAQTEAQKSSDLFMKNAVSGRVDRRARRDFCHRHPYLQLHGRALHHPEVFAVQAPAGDGPVSISMTGQVTLGRLSPPSSYRRRAQATGAKTRFAKFYNLPGADGCFQGGG